MRKALHRGSKQHRDHASQSLLLLLASATHMMVLFFPLIPFVVNHTINAAPPERLQHYKAVSEPTAVGAKKFEFFACWHPY